jgi:hypothetical protein
MGKTAAHLVRISNHKHVPMAASYAANKTILQGIRVLELVYQQVVAAGGDNVRNDRTGFEKSDSQHQKVIKIKLAGTKQGQKAGEINEKTMVRHR